MTPDTNQTPPAPVNPVPDSLDAITDADILAEQVDEEEIAREALRVRSANAYRDPSLNRRRDPNAYTDDVWARQTAIRLENEISRRTRERTAAVDAWKHANEATIKRASEIIAAFDKEVAKASEIRANMAKRDMVAVKAELDAERAYSARLLRRIEDMAALSHQQALARLDRKHAKRKWYEWIIGRRGGAL